MTTSGEKEVPVYTELEMIWALEEVCDGDEEVVAEIIEEAVAHGEVRTKGLPPRF